MISINEAKRLVKRALLANLTTKKRDLAITPLVSGKHGIGKSQMVKSIARELGGACITIEGGTLKEGEITGLPYQYKDEAGQIRFRFLPYYAVEREHNVQVAYLVQYFEGGAADRRRTHEQLDGLWTVGVRNYPVMPQFPDLYSESKNREKALSSALSVYESAGYGYEDFVDYLTWCIRRFQPLVVVSHDLDGEYGHGTHVLCSEALGDALERAADPAQDPDTAAEYGAWQVEKTYLHLYPENQIVMDWDTLLDSLGGKTPFQVTQEGFACHESQHWTWFYRWIYGSASSPIQRAADIRNYSPCLYGLYDTQVGPDSAGGDFFENVQTWAQREQAEAERLAEEERRAEEERKAREQAEAERQAELLAQEQAARRRMAAGVAAGLLIVLVCAVLAVCLVRRRRRR